MWCVPPQFCPLWHVDQTYALAYGYKTIHLSRLWSGFLQIRSLINASKDAHWWETVSMSIMSLCSLQTWHDNKVGWKKPFLYMSIAHSSYCPCSGCSPISINTFRKKSLKYCQKILECCFSKLISWKILSWQVWTSKESWNNISLVDEVIFDVCSLKVEEI